VFYVSLGLKWRRKLA